MTKARRTEPKLSESAELRAALEASDKGGVARLVSHSALAEVTFVNLLAFGNSHFVSPEYIADLLISRTEARGVIAAVAEVERAFCEGVVPAFHVMAVSGLSCSGTFSLGDITIRPFEDLEPSWRAIYTPECPGMTAIVRPTLTPVSVDENATWGNDEWWVGGVAIPEIQLRDQTYEALALFPMAAKLLLTRDRLKPDDWTRLLLGGPIDP